MVRIILVWYSTQSFLVFYFSVKTKKGVYASSFGSKFFR